MPTTAKGLKIFTFMPHLLVQLRQEEKQKQASKKHGFRNLQLKYILCYVIWVLIIVILPEKITLLFHVQLMKVCSTIKCDFEALWLQFLSRSMSDFVKEEMELQDLICRNLLYKQLCGRYLLSEDICSFNICT